MCKTLGSSLNANRGNKKEHRETHIVVTRKLFGDQQVVLGVGVTQVNQIINVHRSATGKDQFAVDFITFLFLTTNLSIGEWRRRSNS